jgi:hypothetical protein
MTYLEIVNKVLRRLREPTVASVSENSYSALIGELVNVAKREIEDSWNWSALRTTLTATTAPDLFNYVLRGAGTRFRVLEIINDTDNFYMQPRDGKWFESNLLMVPVTKGSPLYYNFNGVTTYGDTQVDVFPVPNGVYTLRFNVVMPQDDLTTDAEVVQIPYQLLIEGVLARAIAERGEDGGNQDQEMRYRNMLADLISIENGHRVEETTWYPN